MGDKRYKVSDERTFFQKIWPQKQVWLPFLATTRFLPNVQKVQKVQKKGRKPVFPSFLSWWR